MSEPEAAQIQRLWNYWCQLGRSWAASQGVAFTDRMKELLAIAAREKIRQRRLFTYDDVESIRAKEERAVVQKILDGDV